MLAENKKYVDYIVEQAQNLINIDSPSGYCKNVGDYLLAEFEKLGYKAWRTIKGGIIAELGGEDAEDAVLLAGHCDTLGAIVHEIKGNGHLKMTNVGGMNPNNAETENVRVITKFDGIYEGTCQLVNPSIHVNENYASTSRSWDTIEIVLDENVKSKADVEKLGIMVGDYVCFEPRFRVTDKGYIKSRFLDDKLSSAILIGYAKYLKDEAITLKRKMYLYFTMYEEVGHGCSASIPAGVTEAWSVDMGCVGTGLQCTEHQVSICAKDSGGPYNYEVVKRQIELAKEHGIDFAVDIYPKYGSDVEATLRAGHDIRHGLIGPGVFASHGYERSHVDGVEATFRLIKAYFG